MEQLFIIESQVAVNYLYNNLIPHYMQGRKLAHEVYSVYEVDSKGQEHAVMYVYDCRMFKMTSSCSK